MLGHGANQDLYAEADTSMAHPEQAAELVVWLWTDAAVNVNGRFF